MPQVSSAGGLSAGVCEISGTTDGSGTQRARQLPFLTDPHLAGDGPRAVRAGSCLALGLWPEGVQRLRRSRVGPEDHFCEAVRNDLRVPLTVEGHPRTLSGPSPELSQATTLAPSSAPRGTRRADGAFPAPADSRTGCCHTFGVLHGCGLARPGSGAGSSLRAWREEM